MGHKYEKIALPIEDAVAIEDALVDIFSVPGFSELLEHLNRSGAKTWVDAPRFNQESTWREMVAWRLIYKEIKEQLSNPLPFASFARLAKQKDGGTWLIQGNVIGRILQGMSPDASRKFPGRLWINTIIWLIGWQESWCERASDESTPESTMIGRLFEIPDLLEVIQEHNVSDLEKAQDEEEQKYIGRGEPYCVTTCLDEVWRCDTCGYQSVAANYRFVLPEKDTPLVLSNRAMHDILMHSGSLPLEVVEFLG